MVWRTAALYRDRSFEAGHELIGQVRYDLEQNAFIVVEYIGGRDGTHIPVGERVIFYLGNPGSRYEGFRATITATNAQQNLPEENLFLFEPD